MPPTFSTTSRHSKGNPAEHDDGSPLTSSLHPYSPSLCVQNHVTNTGVVVQLRHIPYSHGLRCYRVERQSSQGENAGPDGNYKNWWEDGGKGPTPDSEDSADDPGTWAVKPASARTVCSRLLNMNDLFLLALLFTVILQPLVMGSRNSSNGSSQGTSSWRPLLLLLISPGIFIPCARMLNAFTGIYIEEVGVVAGVGLQLTSYGVFNTVKSSTFVDLHMIRSIVVHDAFFRYQPIFFLSASVENQPKRLVFFPNTLPRLEILVPVLRGVRSVLFGEAEFGRSLAELEESLCDSTPAGPLGEEPRADLSGAAAGPVSEPSGRSCRRAERDEKGNRETSHASRSEKSSRQRQSYRRYSNGIAS